MATLSLVSAKTVTVTLGKSGTATDISDYTLSGTTITIAAGGTTGSVTLVAIDESPALDEVDETVTLIMSCDATCSVGTPSSQTVTIVDTDAPPVATLSVVSTSINETTGTTSTLVTATLNLVSAKKVTVTLGKSGTATDVSDYTPVSYTHLTLPTTPYV